MHHGLADAAIGTDRVRQRRGAGILRLSRVFAIMEPLIPACPAGSATYPMSSAQGALELALLPALHGAKIAPNGRWLTMLPKFTHVELQRDEPVSISSAPVSRRSSV
ncbi:hypothetical protein XH89_15235 [Bradyrhizobium sp. CCBAU 53340]|nr:hypothetical protein XH89_15235 [Bradyrhizobium sp. CCBAU 53340]